MVFERAEQGAIRVIECNEIFNTTSSDGTEWVSLWYWRSCCIIRISFLINRWGHNWHFSTHNNMVLLFGEGVVKLGTLIKWNQISPTFTLTIQIIKHLKLHLIVIAIRHERSAITNWSACAVSRIIEGLVLEGIEEGAVGVVEGDEISNIAFTIDLR